MKINVGAFFANLKYMGLGMLGIFIVIGVLVLSVYALRHLTKGKE